MRFHETDSNDGSLSVTLVGFPAPESTANPPPQSLAPGSDPGGTGSDPPRAPSSDGTP